MTGLESQLEAGAATSQQLEIELGRRKDEVETRDELVEKGRAEVARASKELEELR